MPKEEKKFSISVDMGAKNNGIFIAKTKGDEIDKKAFLIKFDSINFSKKDRRENRHKVRNYKRRKLAKRLLQEFVDFSKYNDKQKESILGLLNNRGFTYLDGGSEFKQLNEESLNFIKKILKIFRIYQDKKNLLNILHKNFLIVKMKKILNLKRF